MQQISLNDGWKIRWCDGQRGGMPHYIHAIDEPFFLDQCGMKKTIEDHYDPCKWIDAQVPGEIHLDLVKAGLISDPYAGTGVLECRWVEECFWFYRRVFDAPKAALTGLAQLVFECLDYSAIIYLNGEEIARQENAFHPCIVNVSGLLKETGNVLLVRLESGLFSVSDKPIRDIYTATMTVDTLLHKRNYLRKTQSQMEWDWAPRLMNIGISGNVSLQYHPQVVVESVAVNTELDPTLTNGKIRCRVFSSLYDPSAQGLTLTVSVDGKQQVVTYDRIPQDGVFETEIKMDSPALWWPIGYGDQPLYEVTVTLTMGDTVLVEKTRKVGFRHVAVNQQPHPVEGNYFIFEINGKPIFMRGANLVPNDMINVAMTPDRYERLIALALGANFNFLRVWGGGVYESDTLYELCDQKGVMIWQEFVAACATVPIWESELLESFRREAVYQTRRLSGHPSLIAWCGNNEIGMADIQKLHVGEDDPLYHEVLPSIVQKEDPEKYYQPTSPYSFDGSSPKNDLVGDQHPWTVGFENKDSRDYEAMECRFPNEGGVLGTPSLDTLKRCLKPGDGIHSLSWQVHDNMMESWMPGSSADEDLRFWTGISPTQLTLEEYVYLGGFVQGEGFKRYIDNFRRRKYDTSCAVFWMYNDCWPTVRSWTIVDHALRKNPSYHPVRRAFTPVTVAIASEAGNYRLYGINDTLQDWQGEVVYGVFSTDGKTVTETRQAVTLTQNSSNVLALLSDQPLQANELAYACLYDTNGNLITQTRYTAQKYPDLGLLPAQIRIEPTEGGYLLSSDRFAMGVCLDLNGTDMFGDNLFDLFPNRPYFVSTESDEIKVLYELNRFFAK